MKYVILCENVTDGVDRTHHLIFPEYMTHAVVALGYAAAFKQETGKLLMVLSAGTCYQDSGTEWVVEVGSESLKIARDPEQTLGDYNVLNRPEAFNGLVY